MQEIIEKRTYYYEHFVWMLDEGKEVSISFDYTDVIVLRYHDGFDGL